MFLKAFISNAYQGWV